MDPVIADGLRALAGVAFFFGVVPYALIKLVKYEARQPGYIDPFASIDWLDPDRRRN